MPNHPQNDPKTETPKPATLKWVEIKCLFGACKCMLIKSQALCQTSFPWGDKNHVAKTSRHRKVSV